MFVSKILVTAAAAGVAYAGVTTTTKKTTTSTSTAYACQTFTDTYDDLASGASVGTYHGLQYNDWLVTSGTADGTGVVPPSQSNIALFSILQDTEDSGLVSTIPFATITAANGTKSFGVFSLYFACFDQTNGGVAVDHVFTSCGFEVYGFDIWGNPLPSVPFNYGPVPVSAATPLLAQMNYAIFPPLYYANVKNITFVGSSSGLAISDLAPIIDSLVHFNNCS